MNDTAAAVLMLAVSGVSLAMVVRAFRTGRVSLGGSIEATRRDARPTYWFLVALWSLSAIAALGLALFRLLK